MIITDTGFWIALANRKDVHHTQAFKVLESIQEPLITTWPVVTEICHILLSRLGTLAMLRFIQSVDDGACVLFDLKEEHFSRMIVLMKKYQSLPMDLADASLVILAEHLGDGRILSTDIRDFKSYRWKERKPFQNLMTIKN